MRPFIACVLSLYCSLYIYAQKKPLLIFDLEKGTVDSIPLVQFDSTISAEKTAYHFGLFNNDVQHLEQQPPQTGIFKNSKFTRKKRVTDVYDLGKFPIRTSVTISFQPLSETFDGGCSGSLISERHVLTAAHCVSRYKSDSLSVKTYAVCPVFNNGEKHSSFDCSEVQKVFFFKGWNIGTSDIAILTLKKPIGHQTGWLSYGFDKEDTRLADGIFYKFSYPSIHLPIHDPNIYNGDTLYFNYGIVDWLRPSTISIDNTNGIPGESGSSIIKIKNNSEYTSYGTLSLSSKLTHSRIQNWQFYTFKQQIEKDILSSPAFPNNWEDVFLYPNPSSHHITVQSRLSRIQNIQIYDNLGRLIQEQKMNTIKERLVLQHLPSGLYHIKIVTSKDTFLRKFIKTK